MFNKHCSIAIYILLIYIFSNQMPIGGFLTKLLLNFIKNILYYEIFKNVLNVYENILIKVIYI